jgi:predicted deacetylase
VAARLIVSLSGLRDDEADDALSSGAAFTDLLAARRVPVSQLLRPAGLTPESPLVGWLRQRRAAGDALVLHGYDHGAVPAATPTVGRRAEFAALPRHEAGLRLTAARRALTRLALRTDVFVPPRWLASDGTVEALGEQGFRVLADETAVRLLRDPAGDVRSRVLGFRAAGTRPLGEGRAAAELWRARLLLAEVGRTARRGGLVRINVRSKDLRREERVTAAVAAVDLALALGATPLTYAGFGVEHGRRVAS